jgi:hypothetical protein
MPKGIRMGSRADLENRYPTATYINNWDELKEFVEKHPSKTHKITLNDCHGWIEELVPSKKSYGWRYYLTTHTFYGKGMYLKSTKILQKCGFNVILDNWDAKEEL